jgi:excisionase family DNA binding protein
MQKLAVTVNEAAGALGVSPASIRRSIREGELRSIRFRDRVLVPVVEMQRVIQQEGGAGHDENDAQAHGVTNG